MLSPALRLTSFTTGMIFAAIVATIALTSPTPTFATNGRDAVGQCIDSTAGGARCEWSVNDKGEIDICNKSGCVYCASAESECVTADKTRPRPTRPLPVGTEIKTAVGTFTVSKRVYTGSLLKVPPAKSEKE